MADLSFHSRVAVVTGAGRGLGRAYALELARRGCKVVVNDLGGGLKGEEDVVNVADEVVAEIKKAGGEAVASYDSVEAGEQIVNLAIKTFGRIDIVINNAGIIRDISFKRMRDTDWDLIMKVHLKGAYAVTRAAWPHMLKQHYGRIISTASPAGLYGNFGQVNYTTAKMGLVGFAQSLAREGKKNHVYSNVIAPFAGTRMLMSVMPGMPKDATAAMTPDFIVPLTLYLCHESCTETGSIFELGVGTYHKVQIARAKGWTTDEPPSLERIAANWSTITDMKSHELPNAATAVAKNPSRANLPNVVRKIKSKL